MTMHTRLVRKSTRFWAILAVFAALLSPAGLQPDLALASPDLAVSAKMPCPDHADDAAQSCNAQSGCFSPLFFTYLPEGRDETIGSFSLPKAQGIPLYKGPAPPDQPPKQLWIL